MKKAKYDKNIDLDFRRKSIEDRDRLYRKLYLGEIIKEEKPKFKKNSLIIAPVGSGKTHLIENQLIPNGYNKKVLYLTSNTALKDSLCPNNNEYRELMAKENKSVNFFTSENKKHFGDRDYSVHVMTYHEFGSRIYSPVDRRNFLEDIGLIFADEIHSLPVYQGYNNDELLAISMSFLFDEHEGITKFFFTATKEKLDDLEKRRPGYTGFVEVFDYLDHPEIRKYVANTTTYINHISQIRPHLKSKLESFEYHGYKGLAFTNKISEQERIKEIAIEEGFKPIVLWSINNNEHKMNGEQLRVRSYILRSGNIPEPYNLLIINGAMQEGWNLYDDKMRLAILDTVDFTEQIQALGRIRRDVDLVICKTKDKIPKEVVVPDFYIDRNLTSSDKVKLYKEMNILNEKGKVMRWPTLKTLIEESGYLVEEKRVQVNKRAVRVSVISYVG